MDRFTQPARFAAALAGLALALTIAGTFLPFFRIEQAMGAGSGESMHNVLRAWRIDYAFPGQPEQTSPGPPLGLPLVLASVLLLAALVLTVRQAATGRPLAAARRTTLVAAAFLAGAVCTIAVQGAGNLFEDGAPLTVTTVLAGLWLLFAAVLVAAGAAALTHRAAAASRPEWADPTVAYADTTTPPSGVAITVLPPEDD
ncbi:hypothetical protein M8542_20585 [Amycolatopsis sp. OK19-0408]|uniref:Uncharacterized protein n=1 Tax=Amycolatopsis iheyensis TaxID=2945988 RepID=A0A9X2SK90_9PSEU|nr:hypothetical protein [Amycolatopsis iheyensis]MCR6485229.1 hypothetical protein [Amycolatopsis iheyensis]